MKSNTARLLLRLKASMAAREIHPVGGECPKCQPGSQEVCMEYWDLFQKMVKEAST